MTTLEKITDNSRRGIAREQRLKADNPGISDDSLEHDPEFLALLGEGAALVATALTEGYSKDDISGALDTAVNEHPFYN